jgi:cyclopropane-fatty-acyl-phospholipid synthase
VAENAQELRRPTPERGAEAVGFPRLAAPGLRHPGLDRWLGALLRRTFDDARLRFVLRDGSVLHEPALAPAAVVVLRDRRTLLGLLWEPAVRFGDAYASGRIEVEGDLVAGIEAAYAAVERGRRGRRVRGAGHSLRASRANVHRHYDLGNDFYRLWLDERMIYTCAYYPDPAASLEQAQLAKLDHVCRKLRLRPGEAVVEAGCGWGALALHMARRYGVSVRAFNVSAEQVRYAREWAAREGLERQVEFVEDDYRAIRGRFDAFVSVGMLEHVGLGNYETLGRVIDRCLERHGRGLLHFIGQDRPRPLNAWIRRRIFPGAYPPALGEALQGVLGAAGMSVFDVENLRLHYARTLCQWRERFESAADAVKVRYGETFLRTWRLYLAGSEAAFRSGWLQLFQVLFARRGAQDVPWTRAFLYESAPGNL